MEQLQRVQERTCVQLRRYNERLVLQMLRRAGEASRADLARRTKLTNTAVGSIVQSLEEGDLIRFGGRRSEGRGQPSTLISLNPKGVFGVGVRLDRGSIETALVDFGGEIGEKKSRGHRSPQEGERATVWNSTKSMRPSTPPSLPKPECPMPPKGASGVGPVPLFQPTCP